MPLVRRLNVLHRCNQEHVLGRYPGQCFPDLLREVGLGYLRGTLDLAVR